MFCAFHNERISIGTCDKCGKQVCADCQVVAQGNNCCEDCAVVDLAAAKTMRNPRNPLIAAILSIVPGVGQIYNGQLGKGILIFMTCWLIFPWLYGIYDAYVVAKKIDKGEMLVDAPPADYLLASVVIVIIIVFGPFLLYNTLKGYLSLSDININEFAIKNNLKKISKAIEDYEYDIGEYPKSFSKLYFASPPYLEKIYCDTEIDGYFYTCVLSNNDYVITASPASNNEKDKTVYTITTGGILDDDEDDEEND